VPRFQIGPGKFFWGGDWGAQQGYLTRKLPGFCGEAMSGQVTGDELLLFRAVAPSGSSVCGCAWHRAVSGS